jgi:hypothetical protein
MKEKWQLQLDAAFDKYFVMSRLLQQDLEELLAHDEDTQSSRRNFIRAAASLVEGYTACFREMCQVGLETGPGSLSRNEEAVLKNERLYGSAERTKLTIRATFKMFQLPSVPDFGTKEWLQALRFLDKRDRLMHPKSVDDLDVSDSSWSDIYGGSVWLLQQLFGFMSQLARVHGI